MAIPKLELKEMNYLLSKGDTISEIAKKYPDYDYSEIYWGVNDTSFPGKKRTITNRLNKIVTTTNKTKRKELVSEAKWLLDELYNSLKANSKKLNKIDRVPRKDM